MMLPFSVQCITCGNFMVRGTKFNSKKEDVAGETYLGMKIFRFIMKCSQCNALFGIKTDPQNADYAMEFGASRNFELWRDSRDALAAASEAKEAAEEMDPMRALERRTEESRRQIDNLEALEDLRDMRAAQAARGLGPDALLELRRENRDTLGAGAGAGGGGAGGGGDAGWGGELVDDEDAAAARAAFDQKSRGLKRPREIAAAPALPAMPPPVANSRPTTSAFGARAVISVRPRIVNTGASGDGGKGNANAAGDRGSAAATAVPSVTGAAPDCVDTEQNTAGVAAKANSGMGGSGTAHPEPSGLASLCGYDSD